MPIIPDSGGRETESYNKFEANILYIENFTPTKPTQRNLTSKPNNQNLQQNKRSYLYSKYTENIYTRKRLAD